MRAEKGFHDTFCGNGHTRVDDYAADGRSVASNPFRRAMDYDGRFMYVNQVISRDQGERLANNVGAVFKGPNEISFTNDERVPPSLK
jgi:hypothetical protein